MCFRNQNIFEDIQIEYIRQINYPRSGIWLIVDGGGGVPSYGSAPQKNRPSASASILSAQ